MVRSGRRVGRTLAVCGSDDALDPFFAHVSYQNYDLAEVAQAAVDDVAMAGAGVQQRLCRLNDVRGVADAIVTECLLRTNGAAGTRR